MMKKGLLVIFLLALMLPALQSRAQGCSVCTKTASQLGDKGARGLNGGIVYLAMIPLAILGTIGTVWYRHQRS